MKQRLLRIILTCLITLAFALSLSTSTLAHSRRTDSNGGHKDNVSYCNTNSNQKTLLAHLQVSIKIGAMCRIKICTAFASIT
jgi:hypothetical protein